MSRATICIEKNFGENGYHTLSPKNISRSQISALNALRKDDKYVEVSQNGGIQYFKRNGFTIIHIVKKDEDVHDKKAIGRNPRIKIDIIIPGEIFPFSNALNPFIEKCCSIARNIKSQQESDNLYVEVPDVLLVRPSNLRRRIFMLAMLFAITCVAFLYFQEEETQPLPVDNHHLLLNEISKIRTHLKQLNIPPSGDNIQDVNRFFSFYSQEELPFVDKANQYSNIDCAFIEYAREKLPISPKRFNENTLTYENLKSELNKLALHACGCTTGVSVHDELAQTFNFKTYYIKNPNKIKFDGKTGRSEGMYLYIRRFCKEEDSSSNDKRIAAKYYLLLEKWNIVGITKDDIAIRPYYVIQSLFDFLSLERFKQFPQKLENVIPQKPLLERTVWSSDPHVARLEAAEKRLILLSVNGYNQKNNINYISDLYDNYKNNPILEDVKKSVVKDPKYKKLIEFINILTLYISR